MLRKIIFLLVCLSAAASAAGACGGSSGNPTGDATACTLPNVQCGATCSNPQTDPTNCGQCGTACGQGQVCSQGNCASSCGGTLTTCGKSCVDTQVDPANCGGCGKACASGQSCNMGMCGTMCGTGLTACPTDAGVTACIDTTSDSSNCGSCGNVCGPNTTCVSSACTANLVSTGPVGVSGTMTCTTVSGALGRKTAIDDANNLYVAMLCGTTTQTLYVASSQNGGLSYGTPVSTTLTGTEGAILVGTGANPKLYAATTVVNGALTLSVSADLGKTWSAGQVLITPENANFNYGLSMAMYQSTLYVGVSPTLGSTTLDVLRDGTGIGDAGLTDVDDAGFALTAANLTAVNLNDIAVDQSNGAVWAFSEYQGAYHLAVSTNGGLSFGTVSSPTGGGFYTDWVLAKGTIFVASTTDTLYAIPTTAPGTQTTVPGLGAIAQNQFLRSIAADVSGNVYVATATNTDIRVARILYSLASADAGPADGGSSIDSVRIVPSAGSGPSITARQPNAAILAYTLGTSVYATTLAY